MAIHNDTNAKDVVAALRAAGCSVEWIASAGERVPGVPDLLVGKSGRSMLVEVKSPKGKLSEAQERWIAAWRGCPIAIVRTPQEAVTAVAAYL